MEAEAGEPDDQQQPTEDSLQQPARQGDLQRATKIERLSALEAKRSQLQVNSQEQHPLLLQILLLMTYTCHVNAAIELFNTALCQDDLYASLIATFTPGAGRLPLK